MKKYNFNKPLLNIDGSIAKEKGKVIKLSEQLARYILGDTTRDLDILKVKTWSDNLIKKGSLELDEADVETLRDYLEEREQNKTLTQIVDGVVTPYLSSEVEKIPNFILLQYYEIFDKKSS